MTSAVSWFSLLQNYMLQAYQIDLPNYCKDTLQNNEIEKTAMCSGLVALSSLTCELPKYTQTWAFSMSNIFCRMASVEPLPHHWLTRVT